MYRTASIRFDSMLIALENETDNSQIRIFVVNFIGTGTCCLGYGLLRFSPDKSPPLGRRGDGEEWWSVVPRFWYFLIDFAVAKTVARIDEHLAEAGGEIDIFLDDDADVATSRRSHCRAVR